MGIRIQSVRRQAAQFGLAMAASTFLVTFLALVKAAPTSAQSDMSQLAVTWKQLDVPGPSHPAGNLVYDAARNVVIMFGGWSWQGSKNPPSNDTWVWDGTSWQLQHTSMSPPPQEGSGSMAYDASRQQVVFYGGLGRDETWTWDGNTWTQQHPASSPGGARDYAAMAYDDISGTVILFGGGYGLKGDTWSWDGTNWNQLTPTTSPQPRLHAQLAAAGPHQGLVLYGGCCRVSEKQVMDDHWFDTWTWDGGTWHEETSLPAPRVNPGLGYVPAANGTLLYGGDSQRTVPPGRLEQQPATGDAWLWTAEGWKQQATYAPLSEPLSMKNSVVTGTNSLLVLVVDQGRLTTVVGTISPT